MSEPNEPQEDPQPAPPAPPSPEVLGYQRPAGASEQWTTVLTAGSGEEASLAVNTLQAQGLHARTDFENTAALGALAGAGPGTLTNVQVLAADVEAARAILADIDRAREK